MADQFYKHIGLTPTDVINAVCCCFSEQGTLLPLLQHTQLYLQAGSVGEAAGKAEPTEREPI